MGRGIRTFVARSFAGGAVGRSLLQGIARSVGGAAVAGLGWRLGVDLYEAFKRWALSPPPPSLEEENGEPAGSVDDPDRGP